MSIASQTAINSILINSILRFGCAASIIEKLIQEVNSEMEVIQITEAVVKIQAANRGSAVRKRRFHDVIHTTT